MARRRILNGLVFVLVLLAAWQGGEGLYIHAKAWLAQALLEEAWAKARNGAVTPRPWPWADTTPVARLSVPRLDVDRIVLAGGSGRTLAFGPGHVDGSAPPGGAGISVIAGHRDTHFRFLKDLVPGDRIEIEAPNGNRTSYRVAGATIADARYQTLDPAGARPRLALVTCYPFDAVWPGGPMRYVVFAEARAEAQPARMMAASGIERPGIGALGLVTAGIAAPGVTAP